MECCRYGLFSFVPAAKEQRVMGHRANSEYSKALKELGSIRMLHGLLDHAQKEACEFESVIRNTIITQFSKQEKNRTTRDKGGIV